MCSPNGSKWCLWTLALHSGFSGRTMRIPPKFWYQFVDLVSNKCLVCFDPQRVNYWLLGWRATKVHTCFYVYKSIPLKWVPFTSLQVYFHTLFVSEVTRVWRQFSVPLVKLWFCPRDLLRHTSDMSFEIMPCFAFLNLELPANMRFQSAQKEDLYHAFPAHHWEG